MPTGTTGLQRRQKRRHDAKLAILDVAEKLFLANGFRETKMEDIAAGAELATGSLYRHFETKEDLRQALVSRAIEVDTDYLERAYDPTKSAVEQLKNLSSRYVQFGIDHPLYFRLLATPDVFGPRDPEKADAIASGIAQLVDRIAQVINTGITKGELTPELEKGEDVGRYAENSAKFLHGAWNGLIELTLRDDSLRIDAESFHDILDIGVRILQYGLSPRQPSRTKQTPPAPGQTPHATAGGVQAPA